MECTQAKEHLIDYLEGDLSLEEILAIEQHLKHCAECNEEKEELLTLNEQFKQSASEQPSENLRSGFYQLLEEEKKNRTNASPSKWVMIRPLWKNMAAVVAILLTGVLLGRWIHQTGSSSELQGLKEEIKATQELVMLSMLSHQSVSERYQAVNQVQELDNVNQEVILVLINMMNNDENTLVRMAAAEALSQYSKRTDVKEALVYSLSTQRDANVQILLIDILVGLKERKAVGELYRLLEQENLVKEVELKAQYALGKLI
ncbi:HEAT repeat domain-containing protein [Rapidithrix thailandica]|uniref:HEAT repeat domain-containing protein n=1 Tax=Rapidithrix thailandica TaxID=413964 RepID=A0AAW9S335_9BACT